MDSPRADSVWPITTDLTTGIVNAKLGDESEFAAAHTAPAEHGKENSMRNGKRDMSNQKVQCLTYKDPFANIYKKYVPQKLFSTFLDNLIFVDISSPQMASIFSEG